MTVPKLCAIVFIQHPLEIFNEGVGNGYANLQFRIPCCQFLVCVVKVAHCVVQLVYLNVLTLR